MCVDSLHLCTKKIVSINPYFDGEYRPTLLSAASALEYSLHICKYGFNLLLADLKIIRKESEIAFPAASIKNLAILSV